MRSILRLALIAVGCALFALPSSADTRSDDAQPAATDSSVVFYSAVRTIRLGRTEMIPVHAAALTVRAENGERTAIVSAGDPQIIEIVERPRLQASETSTSTAPVAFLRVRGRSIGTTRVRIGGASLKVDVVARRPESMAFSAELFQPRVTGVVPRAALCGEITLGLIVADDPLRSAAVESCWIDVYGSSRVLMTFETSRSQGIHRHAVGLLDTTALAVGRVILTPVVQHSSGGQVRGDSVVCEIIRCDPESSWTIECESAATEDRPRIAGARSPRVQRDPEASGGACIVNASPNPAFTTVLDVERTASYQVFVRARGSFAGGAFPAIAIYVDDEPRPQTLGAAVSTSWHRTPIGRPVDLAAGPHAITVRFQNDFYAPGLSDRNLALDRFELVRIERAKATSSATSRPVAGLAEASHSNDSTGPRKSAGSSDLSTEPPTQPAFGAPSDPTDPMLIGLDQPLDGRRIFERFRIGAHIRTYLGPREAPRVDLIVDGTVRATEHSLRPVFWLDMARLREESDQVVADPEETEHVVSLRATLGEFVVRTPDQHIVVASRDAVTDGPDIDATLHRFSVWDPAWADGVVDRLQSGRGMTSAALMGNGTVRLDLPDDLAGEFDVFVEASGDGFEGPPLAVVRKQGSTGDATEIGSPRVWGGPPNFYHAGSCELDGKTDMLTVSFENDHYVEGRGDRNLRLVSIAVRPRGVKDRTLPEVSIVHPRPNSPVSMVDAIVVEVTDDSDLQRLDLFIDGANTGIQVGVPRGAQRFRIPFFGRDLTPGRHELQVRAIDRAQNARTTGSVPILFDPELSEPTAYDRAVALLDRFGFGPDPVALSDLLALGESEFCRRAIHGAAPFTVDHDLALRDAATFLHSDFQSVFDVSTRRLHHMLETRNPMRARFVQFIENHFSTWIRKTGGAQYEWDDHTRFEQLGFAPFLDLLTASATSPAMLFYLDQTRSFAGALNENYGREILELHTLGVDAGYSQEDVTALARILAGWRFHTSAHPRGIGATMLHAFTFDPRLASARSETILGVPFDACGPELRFDRSLRAIEILAAHPTTADTFCTKIVRHYSGEEAPEAWTAELVRCFHETGGDTRAILGQMFKLAAGATSTLPTRLAKPVDYGVRLFRTIGSDNPAPLQRFLSSSGTAIFDRSSPDGYPEDDADYTDSNGMLQRWRLAGQQRWQIARLIPGSLRREPKDPEKLQQWRQRMIDLVAVSLTGRLLSVPSNEAALELFEETEDPLFTVALFIAQTPEAQMR